MSCRHRGPTRCVYRPTGGTGMRRVGGKERIGVGVVAQPGER